MGDPQATHAELGWLAGIIDGEGWLGMSILNDKKNQPNHGRRPNTVKCELKITNCDEEIIEKSSMILTKLGVNPYRRSHKQLSSVRRVVHECAIKNMTAIERVVPPILPYLTGIKRQRADIILRFIELRRANPGVSSVGYNYTAGSRGPRTLRPYSPEELQLIAACRELQQRGASETSRATRTSALKSLIEENADALERSSGVSEMI